LWARRSCLRERTSGHIRQVFVGTSSLSDGTLHAFMLMS